ncbi:hypothetical protein [Bdellovibrio sp. BCCA]|uniref:hypothetical protein n=1 Tax=Bdellovibrio sp. BCCA TaxID=3136281 RepID=UPI0030F12E45
MIQIKVAKIDKNSGMCEGTTEDGRLVTFSQYKIQDGDRTQSTIYKLQPGVILYADSKNLDTGVVGGYLYTSPLEKMNITLSILRDLYSIDREQPLIGDWVIDEDRKMKRLRHYTDGTLQLVVGSFHFCPTDEEEREPSVTLSAGVPDYEKRSVLIDTGKMALAEFWTFKDFDVKAENRVNIEVPVKIWKIRS